MKLTDQEQVILKAIGNGVAEVSRVIKAVGYPKATVKKVLVRLSEKGVVALHRHDWPSSLKPEQRKLMVKIGSNYYSAVSVMKRNPKQSKGKTALKKTGRALKGFARGALQSGAEILGAGAMALNPTKMTTAIARQMGEAHAKAGKKLTPYDAREADKILLAAAKAQDPERPARKYAELRDAFNKGWEKAYFSSVSNPRRKKNKTIIKAKRVVVLNPKKKPAKKATKRRRNLDHRDSKHQVEVRKHWRAGGLSQWQRAHKAGQHDLFAHGIKARNPQYVGEYMGVKMYFAGSSYNAPSLKLWGFATDRQLQNAIRKALAKKTRNASRTISTAKTAKRRAGASSQNSPKIRKARSKKIAVKRNASPTTRTKSSIRSRKAPVKRASKRAVGRRNPSAESIRKEFAGSVNGERDLFFPQGTPAGKLAKLGKLVSITTEEGTIKPVSGTAWLCADTRGKLHIGSTSGAPLFDGPKRSFGHVTKLEYESSKPHLGYRGPIIWFHRAGEENGIRPTLHADGKGGLVFRGGDYRLTQRGIEN